MNKLGGSCIECGSIIGKGHREHCSKYIPEEPYKHPWVDDLMPLEEVPVPPKDKTSKPDWSIFPFSEAEEVLKAFSFGAKKYGAPFTYRQGAGVTEADLLSAAFRHLIAIQNGEQIDPDSQCLHWSHLACNSLMAIATLRKVKS